MGDERLARASASPTWSGPEGSSHNEPHLGRCPASHLRKPLYLEDYHDYFLDPLGRDALKSFHFPRRFAAAHDACQVIKLARYIQ